MAALSITSTPDLTQGLETETENDKSPVEVTKNTQAVLNMETKIDIEEEGECKPQSNDAQLLRDAICTDKELHSVVYSECKDASPTHLHVDYGSKRSRKPVWVQFNMDYQDTGEEIPPGSREPFIRLVLSVVFLCLFVTFLFAVFTFVVPGVRSFCARNGIILCIVGCVLILSASLKLTCYEYGRSPPCNYVGLLVAVVAKCLIFAAISAMMELKEVLLGLAVTCFIVIICFCLAFTPLDFTKCYMFVCVIGIALAGFALGVLIMRLITGERMTMIRLVLCCAFVVYFSFSLVMEIQMVLGGKTVVLGESDWVLGAFLLYTCIMSIFINVLKIILLLSDFD